MSKYTEISHENENGNKKIKTDSIKYITYKSPNNKYKLCEINGNKFIVIDNNNDNIFDTWKEHCIEYEIDDWRLINSLLKLKEQLPYSIYYEMLEKGNVPDNKILEKIENELSKKNVNQIINWCRIYGLPFLGEAGIECSTKKQYSWFGFKNDLKTCFDKKVYGFRIGTFLIGLNTIYKTAICGIKLAEINLGAKKDENRHLNKTVLEEYVRKATQAAQFHYEISDNSKYMMYDLELHAETLLSAAMYTLQLWICMPNDDRSLKRCATCNCHFITKDPREEYCGNPCTKYTRNKKIKRKGIKKRN